MQKTILPAQCRAARGLIAWSQDMLAKKARVSRGTVADFEREARMPIENNMSAIQAALEAAGVEFTNDEAPGVRLRSPKGQT